VDEKKGNLNEDIKKWSLGIRVKMKEMVKRKKTLTPLAKEVEHAR